MYHIIGKRPAMTPAAQTIADSALGACIGPGIIGVYLSSAPDGVIVENDGRYYETGGGRLVGIDPENPGEMVCYKLDPPYTPTALEIGQDLKAAVTCFENYLLHYKYGDRHRL